MLELTLTNRSMKKLIQQEGGTIAVESNDITMRDEFEYKNHKVMRTMDTEKREALFDAAMKEFSKGYAAANTDDIVAAAGISKGLLFHYFGSKKGLYQFLLHYALDTINAEYDNVILESNDFLENICRVSKLAADLIFRYPVIYGFLTRSYFSSEEVGVIPNHSPSEKLIQKIFKQSDKLLFRDDIDLEKAQNIILWAMNGYIDSISGYGSDIEKYQKNYDLFLQEFEKYLNILRKIFYK